MLATGLPHNARAGVISSVIERDIVDVRRVIDAYLQVRPQTSDPFLSISSRDRQLTTRAVEDVVTKYACLAGLENVQTPSRHPGSCSISLTGDQHLTRVLAGGKAGRPPAR
jgi:hypothetical protein